MFRARLDDYVDEANPVRAVDVFVDAHDLATLGFDAVSRAAGGRPAYHPATLLKMNIYGYLNRILSSQRLEREAQRNLELICLTGHQAPDFKTIFSGTIDIAIGFVMLAKAKGTPSNHRIGHVFGYFTLFFGKMSMPIR